MKKHVAVLMAAALVASTLAGTTVPASAAVIAVPAHASVAAGGAHVPWALFACPASIVITAFAIGARDKRELTAAEAWSCGLLAWVSKPKKHK